MHRPRIDVGADDDRCARPAEVVFPDDDLARVAPAQGEEALAARRREAALQERVLDVDELDRRRPGVGRQRPDVEQAQIARASAETAGPASS